MIVCKSPQEIGKMRLAGVVVAQVIQILKKKVKPGITTKELNDIASEEMRKRDARSAFLGYRSYPAAICTSINDEVVHGIPSQRTLKNGDIVSIDIGVILNGYFGDAAITLAVGDVSAEARNLINVTKNALEAGVGECVPGNKLYDVSAAIQEVAEKAGYSVIREYVGHGIGQEMHEDPQIPNFGKRGTGPLLKEGMVLALEPMVNVGTSAVKVSRDEWTVKTADGKLSAHFEHTVAITEGTPEILTFS